jgi:hypothetical protein
MKEGSGLSVELTYGSYPFFVEPIRQIEEMVIDIKASWIAYTDHYSIISRNIFLLFNYESMNIYEQWLPLFMKDEENG